MSHYLFGEICEPLLCFRRIHVAFETYSLRLRHFIRDRSDLPQELCEAHNSDTPVCGINELPEPAELREF